MGYDLEVDMIREAASLGLLTCPYVFDVSTMLVSGCSRAIRSISGAAARVSPSETACTQSTRPRSVGASSP